MGLCPPCGFSKNLGSFQGTRCSPVHLPCTICPWGQGGRGGTDQDNLSWEPRGPSSVHWVHPRHLAAPMGSSALQGDQPDKASGMWAISPGCPGSRGQLPAAQVHDMEARPTLSHHRLNTHQ